MKVKPYLLAAIFAASGLAPVLAQAPGSEQPSNNPPPPPPPADGERPKERKVPGFLQNLPPEIRKRFDDAREKALQDPKIQELRKASEKANRDFFDAMRAKMQEIDPGLADIIKKNAPEGKMGREGREGREGRDGRGKAGFENLTEAERDQLLAAREKAKDDPAVKAAKDKRDAAATPEERQEAGDAHRKILNETILKIDPSLEPVLKKLGPPAGGPPPPKGAGDEMAPPPPPAPGA